MQESTESLSFLRLFLEFKSCHPRNSTLRPFFHKTNAAIAFGRPKNLGLEVFVTNGASTSRQTPCRSSRRTTTRRHRKSEVRKSLQTTTAKEELLLGHDIFNTHFTDMASNDIINKSGENDGSKYIEELKFPMINHPDPYKLQWFNKGNEVKVSQHFIISFSIDNNYKENVWCDVIPMDTCHINLGRPCQYDRRALYDGYVNTCFFVKDVIEIKLAPLPVNEFNDGEEVFKLLGLSLTMEPFKDKTKSCLLRPVPKPPWENVIVVAVRIKKKLLNSRTSSVQPGENDTE